MPGSGLHDAYGNALDEHGNIIVKTAVPGTVDIPERGPKGPQHEEESETPHKIYETYWIRPGMAEIKKKTTIRVKVGTKMVKRKKRAFSKEMIEVEEDGFEFRERWVGTGKYSDTLIDIAELDRSINECANRF